MRLDIGRILESLPHRYPFLLVDRILEMDIGRRVVAIKNVTVNEPFFAGHFPCNPVMPGVLIVEALAQAGAVMLLVDRDEETTGKYFYMAGVDKARFRRPVVPGDQLRLELDVLSVRRRFCKMRGVARVEGAIVAEAEIMSMMVDRMSGDAS